MRVAIIGAGKVGSAIAKGLAGKGHQLVLGSRRTDDPDLIETARTSGAEIMSQQDAANSADVIILSLPWSVAQDVAQSIGPLEGKVIIDCMNPLAMTGGVLGLTIGHLASGGELMQAWLPKAHIVKTLNQVGAEMMADNSHLPCRPAMFMAGNEAAAKAIVATLLTDLGFEALDAGDLTKARLLEPLGMVWINQSLFRGKGRNWAFAAVSG